MKLRTTLVICAVLACVATPVFAHHGVAWYDYSKTLTAKVTVTRFDWTNPHCKIYFDTVDTSEIVRHWVVEMHPPNNLLEHGWTWQTLHAGDQISLSFRPAKNYSTTGLLEEVTLPNGVTLRQNLLLLPPGETMTIQEWTRRYARRPVHTGNSAAHAESSPSH